MNLNFRRATMAIVLCAGLATSAWAQNEIKPTDRPMEAKPGMKPDGKAMDRAKLDRTSDHRSCHWLSSRDIVGSDESSIAKMNDLLIDRGSGRVEYAIITTGSVMGLGGRDVAVPFRALRWDPVKERFQYAADKEELKQLPEWTEKDWTSQVSTTEPSARDTTKPAGENGMRFSDYAYNRDQSRSNRWDPYGKRIDTGASSKLSGEVISVDRNSGRETGEETIVTIKDESGTTHRVALGPSWYISGLKAAPRRGDRITIDTYGLRESSDGLRVATSYHVNDQDFALRRENDPTWAQYSYERDGRWYGQPYYRNVLVSKLRGAGMDCRNVACGSVDDVIIDVNNARAAFISIDPDKNFLGIADTKHLVPWSVVSVGVEGTVRVDTSRDMMLGGTKTPSDLATLNSTGSTDTIYKSYQVTPPSPWHEAESDRDMKPRNPSDPNR